MFYLTTQSTHFIYGYMASDIWLRTILIVRKETRCRHIAYSFQLTAMVLLYAPSHRQDSTYHGLCDTSRGALDGTRNSSMGPPHEGSIRRPKRTKCIVTQFGRLGRPPGWNECCVDADGRESIARGCRWRGQSHEAVQATHAWSSCWNQQVQLLYKLSCKRGMYKILANSAKSCKKFSLKRKISLKKKKYIFNYLSPSDICINYIELKIKNENTGKFSKVIQKSYIS